MPRQLSATQLQEALLTMRPPVYVTSPPAMTPGKAWNKADVHWSVTLRDELSLLSLLMNLHGKIIQGPDGKVTSKKVRARLVLFQHLFDPVANQALNAKKLSPLTAECNGWHIYACWALFNQKPTLQTWPLRKNSDMQPWPGHHGCFQLGTSWLDDDPDEPAEPAAHGPAASAGGPDWLKGWPAEPADSDNGQEAQKQAGWKQCEWDAWHAQRKQEEAQWNNQREVEQLQWNRRREAELIAWGTAQDAAAAQRAEWAKGPSHDLMQPAGGQTCPLPGPVLCSEPGAQTSPVLATPDCQPEEAKGPSHELMQAAGGQTCPVPTPVLGSEPGAQTCPVLATSACQPKEAKGPSHELMQAAGGQTCPVPTPVLGSEPGAQTCPLLATSGCQPEEAKDAVSSGACGGTEPCDPFRHLKIHELKSMLSEQGLDAEVRECIEKHELLALAHGALSKAPIQPAQFEAPPQGERPPAVEPAVAPAVAPPVVPAVAPPAAVVPAKAPPAAPARTAPPAAAPPPADHATWQAPAAAAAYKAPPAAAAAYKAPPATDAPAWMAPSGAAWKAPPSVAPPPPVPCPVQPAPPPPPPPPPPPAPVAPAAPPPAWAHAWDTGPAAASDSAMPGSSSAYPAPGSGFNAFTAPGPAFNTVAAAGPATAPGGSWTSPSVSNGLNSGSSWTSPVWPNGPSNLGPANAGFQAGGGSGCGPTLPTGYLNPGPAYYGSCALVPCNVPAAPPPPPATPWKGSGEFYSYQGMQVEFPEGYHMWTNAQMKMFRRAADQLFQDVINKTLDQGLQQIAEFRRVYMGRN